MNIQDRQRGWTAAMFAFSKANIDCLMVLINSGADIYLKDDEGESLSTYLLKSKTIPEEIKKAIRLKKKIKLEL